MSAPTSLIERALQGAGSPEALLSHFAQEEQARLRYTWRAWARPEQLPPRGDWLTWLMLSGRGSGKTRAAAEFIRAEVEAGRAGRIALVGKTPADIRDVMIEGESGLLNVCPPENKPDYQPSLRRLTWPNGARAITYSSHEPDELRGPQCDLGWGDEIRTWANATETWDNLMFGLRLGKRPRVVATTTPLPIKLIKTLMAEPTTVISRGSTYDNRANLAPSFFRQIVAKYEGTRLGRQEIHAELLEDVPGALWKRSFFVYQPAPRMTRNSDGTFAPNLSRIVVAIDPAVTSGEGSDETGIIIAGCAGEGAERRYWVLDDRSLRASPHGWATAAIVGYRALRGDRIIGEVNNGGEMVEATLRTIDPNVPYTAVHASRGKQARAEPIAALYEQGKVSHVRQFSELEDQCCTWTLEEGKSPDRMDALVWALTELSNQDQAEEIVVASYDSMALVGSVDL